MNYAFKSDKLDVYIMLDFRAESNHQFRLVACQLTLLTILNISSIN